MKNSVFDFIDHISVARKTAILIAVISAGVLFLGAFGHLGLYQLKNSYDDIYNTKYQSVVKLNQLNALYTIDKLDTKNEIQWQEFKKYDFNLERKEYIAYKKLTRKVDRNIEELHRILKNSQDKSKIESFLNKLHQNFSDITMFIHKKVQHDSEIVNERYNYTVLMMMILTLFLLIFSIFFTRSIIKKTKKLINSLAEVVKNKIDDYENLAHNYEDKVTKEVIRNREKDQIMYQHARLAAMGEMIGNIAHQWRQPLNALTILIQSFGTKSMAGKLDQEFIDKQVDEGLRLADQMSNTIEDFRNFFSPHRDREYFSLVKSLNDTLELVEFFCKDEHIDIKILAKEDLRVFGYSNEFAQVILNLINNARDNFKQKNMNDERKIIIKLEKKNRPKPYALISFIDNGGGIDPKIKDRIFEPYFTTKHKSTGTGIGLYMSKQIIEKQMQGLVTMKNIESKLGGDKVYKCAQFIIAIPIK
jgi:signal transduction histidine kinase